MLLKSKMSRNLVNTTRCLFAHQDFCNTHLGSKEESGSSVLNGLPCYELLTYLMKCSIFIKFKNVLPH